MLVFIFIRGQLESKGVEGRISKIGLFPFNLKAVTSKIRIISTFKQTAVTCFVYLTGTTSFYVFISFKLSFINWSTWATGLVRILTRSCSCWLVSKDTKTSCKWHPLSRSFKNKNTSLYALSLGVSLPFDWQQKNSLLCSASVLFYFRLNAVLVFYVSHLWMMNWKSV